MVPAFVVPLMMFVFLGAAVLFFREKDKDEAELRAERDDYRLKWNEEKLKVRDLTVVADEREKRIGELLKALSCLNGDVKEMRRGM